jgi:hypothetical protein
MAIAWVLLQPAALTWEDPWDTVAAILIRLLPSRAMSINA